jgi:hypothetical protein
MIVAPFFTIDLPWKMYPLVMTNIAIEAMVIEIVDLPMKSMVTFHRFWPGQLAIFKTTNQKMSNIHAQLDDNV